MKKTPMGRIEYKIYHGLSKTGKSPKVVQIVTPPGVKVQHVKSHWDKVGLLGPDKPINMRADAQDFRSFQRRQP